MRQFLCAFGYIIVGAVLGVVGIVAYSIYVLPYGGSSSLIPVDIFIGMLVLTLIVAVVGMIRMAAKLGRAVRLFMSEERAE